MALARTAPTGPAVGVADARINEEFLAFLDDPHRPSTRRRHRPARARGPAAVGRAGRRHGTRSLEAVAALGDGLHRRRVDLRPGDADPIILVSPDGTNVSSEDPPHVGPGTQRYVDVCVGPDDTAVVVGVGGAQRAPTTCTPPSASPRGGRPPADRSPAGATSRPTPARRARTASSSSAPTTAPATATPGCGPRPTAWSGPRSSRACSAGPATSGPASVAAVPGGGWLVAGTDTGVGRRRHRPVAHRLVGRRHPPRPRRAGAPRARASRPCRSIAIDEDGHVTLAGNDYGRVGLWESSTVDR